MQNTGLNRVTIDKYYTKKDVVTDCVQLIKSNIYIDRENDLIIEPSAGNGAFVDDLRKLCNHCDFYDIQPDHESIEEQDYLELIVDIETHMMHPQIHVVGNPPFGRQSTHAIKFIKKSVEFCDSISFILPRSFKKDSMKKHFPLDFHLVLEKDIPSESFLVDGKSHDVPCIFQIWEKRETKREKPQKHKPYGYEFVKKEGEHDISFRRVGVYAGAIDTNTENKSSQSHYFIRFQSDTGSCLEQMMDELKSIDFGCKDNTVGPRSISKQELMKEFNAIIQKHVGLP